MSKWYLKLLSVFVVVGLLMGCGSDGNNGNDGNNETNANQEETNTTESNTSDENEEADTVTITLSMDDESEYIDEEEAEIEEGDILMDVLKETFAVEEEDGFITSIQGVEPDEDEDKAWMIYINGEMAEKGANDTELSPGDEVSLDLQEY